MATPSRLTVGRAGTGYLLRVLGRGTMRESPAAHEFASRVLDNGGGPLYVALDQCDYLDSTFLGALVDLHRHHGRCDPPRFSIAATSATRARLLGPNHLVGLLRAVEEVPSVIGEEVELPTGARDSRDLGQHVMECHRRLAELDGPNRLAFERIADQLARELVNH